ncbi:hypothetical protein SORDD14_01502 [Streptococcus oralis]|uniref:Uncharacterized protein n=1 Tax=Streptococcus oralis TaxID=1303 RepID=A0A139NWD2_STROR|nr:hypothetical protein SORDD14_01502 [Streptococcus oralis]
MLYFLDYSLTIFEIGWHLPVLFYHGWYSKKYQTLQEGNFLPPKLEAIAYLFSFFILFSYPIF